MTIGKYGKDALEERECFVSGDTSIVQSNYLIERKSKLSMPSTQLLYTLTGMINKDDDDFKEYKVDVTSFAKLWGVDLKNAYKYVTEALTELGTNGIREHTVDPETGEKYYLMINFISYGRYVEGEGFARVHIDPSLKPHYIALKNRFTMYSLDNIIKLLDSGGQVHAMRIYELLKQYQSIGSRSIKVSEFKEQLGLLVRNKKGNITSEKYKGNNSNLTSYVLDPAVEQINQSTDIKVSYSIIGRGSKASIEFTITANARPAPEPPTAPTDDESLEETFESMADLEDERELREDICNGFGGDIFTEFSLDELRMLKELAWSMVGEDEIKYHNTILKDLGIAHQYAVADYVRRKILLCNAQRKPVRSRIGFIRSAVKDNWI